jgi:hypothetical protein
VGHVQRLQLGQAEHEPPVQVHQVVPDHAPNFKHTHLTLICLASPVILKRQ